MTTFNENFYDNCAKEAEEITNLLKEFNRIIGSPEERGMGEDPLSKSFMTLMENVKEGNLLVADVNKCREETQKVYDISKKIHNLNPVSIDAVLKHLGIPFFWNVLEEIERTAELVDKGVDLVVAEIRANQ